LHAFHDDAIFFFDAWEEGFAGAAAMAVQTTPGVAPGYNPFDPGPFYCLSVYECENQPALGGPSFYPPSAFPGMLVWRLAMARAAWFKCYIEDPEFFRKFNAEYYRRYTPALAGDTFGLKEIAASVLPQVEGMSFYEWYNRQWVLDTSVQVGPKLFTWNIPLKESVALIVEYFSTSGSGAETPLGGQAMTIYWSYDFSVSLYAEEGNVISVPASGEGAGEGFLIPTFFNIGGPQRITVQIDIGNLRAYYPYPYGMRGFEPGENNIYGGIIDAIDGSVDISGGAEASGVTVSRGVWGKEILNGNLVPTQLTITYRTPDGQPASRTVNVGWDSYVVFLRGGGQVTVTHRFPAGVHLMSLPVYVLTPSAPQVLGVSEDQLLMARWYPRMSGTGAYRLWPDLEGFAPGKAFWLKLFSPLDVEVKGIPPDPNIDFPVTLQFGWNMVGVPRQGAISTSSLRFQLGTDPSVSFEEAVQRRWISDAVFGYTMSRGYEKADLLQPFRGYWMRSLITAELRVLFPPVAASQGRKKNASVPEANEALGIRIIGRSEDDAANVVIVHAADAGRAVQTDPSPPPGPAGLQLSISRTPSGILDTPSWRVSTPLVAGKWEVTLCGPPGARVSLYAEPLGGAKLAVALAAEGRQLPLGLRSAEVTVPLSGRLLLQLDVSHERPWSPAPLLTALAASATSQTACITYTLSRAASVEATVLNMAGRPVRRMVRVAETAGRHSISWNLTSDYGAPVPAGLYLVRLSASAPDGSYQQGVAPLRIVR
ncbi:MAG: hypothetical protein H5T86_06380, partial [Armatimonadetes bacterium]|nr:hypothetical protein [Armatimonadota bacterium]